MILAIDATGITAGGVLQYLASILKYQTKQNQFRQVVVFGQQNHIDLLRPWNVEFELIPQPSFSQGPLGNPWVKFKWLMSELPSQISKLKPDLLFSPGGLLPYRHPRSFRAVTMSHNMLIFDGAEAQRYGFGRMRLRFLLLRWQQTRSFRLADGVIFISEYARDVVCNILPSLRSRSVVIPLGVDQRFYRARPFLHFAQDSVDILYVSSIHPYKHHIPVVKALKILTEKGHPNLRLHIVGESYPPSIRRLRREIIFQGLDSKVFYHGLQPVGDIVNFCHRANIFIFASSCENCPSILLEAMASGLPIACSERPPMPEFAGDSVIYFDPEDTQSIVLAISKLLKDEELRQKLGYRAYERSLSFSWDRCAYETYAYLSRVGQF